MSMARSVPSSWTIIPSGLYPSPKFRIFFFAGVSSLTIRNRGVGNKTGIYFQDKQSLSLLSTNQRAPRDVTVYASIPPAGSPLPSGSPSNSWRNWILGMVITLILPFFTHKWGPLQAFLKRIDNAVETAEQVADVVEAVANKVEKVAEDISDGLPEGGKLRKTMDFVEDVAEIAAKDAHLAGDLIDKVEELEEKVESLIEPVGHDHKPAHVAPKEMNSSVDNTKQN